MSKWLTDEERWMLENGLVDYEHIMEIAEQRRLSVRLSQWCVGGFVVLVLALAMVV